MVMSQTRNKWLPNTITEPTVPRQIIIYSSDIVYCQYLSRVSTSAPFCTSRQRSPHFPARGLPVVSDLTSF